MKQNTLYTLLTANEERLLNDIFCPPDTHKGETCFSALKNSRGMAMPALFQVMKEAGETPGCLQGTTPSTENAIRTFARHETRCQRKNGSTLKLFLAQIKAQREACRLLVKEKASSVDEAEFQEFLLIFFDQLEMFVAEEWETQEFFTSKPTTDNLLANEKNMFLSLADNIPNSLFLFDTKQRLVFFNAEAARFLGVARTPKTPRSQECFQEKVSCLDAQAHTEQMLPWLKERIGHALIDGNPRQQFEAILHIYGKDTHFNVSLVHMYGPAGNVQGAIVTLEDITERKRSEQALRKSEEKFRRIFETIDDGYFLTGLDGTVLMVNPAAAAKLGYEEKNMLGFNVLKQIYKYPEDRDVLINVLKEQGSVEGYRVDFRQSNGSFIKVEVDCHLVYNDTKHAVALEGVFRDATDRIRAEEILREREQQYRGFFMNNHAVMLLSDPKTGDIVDANPAAERFYGYDRDVLLKMNMSAILASTEEEIFREMIRAQSEHRNHFLLKHKPFGETERDVEVYSGPVMVNERTLLYSVIHDVTKRRQLEKELQKLATIDSLTGAFNRHEFMRRAQAEMVRARRYDHPLSVLMLDLDYFKYINDTYGHRVGDDALGTFAEACRECLRETDVFGRLGGEEFAIVLTETQVRAAKKAAERLRKTLAVAAIDTGKGPTNITTSIGLSAMTTEDESIDDILNRADKALYKAKHKGRNRVERL